jgi:hypothetical protein
LRQTAFARFPEASVQRFAVLDFACQDLIDPVKLIGTLLHLVFHIFASRQSFFRLLQCNAGGHLLLYRFVDAGKLKGTIRYLILYNLAFLQRRLQQAGAVSGCRR